MSLLRNEFKSWGLLDQSLTAAKGKSIPFGKYMSDKYKFAVKDLEDEIDSNKAMLIILKNHVQEIK
tara:strand:- start:4157 stop:4354 length:198 start_codon:yes stop_codon:yes gene_type:complete